MIALVLAGALAASSQVRDAERAFLAFRDAEDRARSRPSAHREEKKRAKALRAIECLDRLDPAGLSEDDRRAVTAMRAALTPEPLDEDSLTKSIYEAFGRAAEAIPFDGETIDRLTVLSRLAIEPDGERRRRLFLTLEPTWRTVAGRPGESTPYAELVKRRLSAWSKRGDGTPFDRKAREWGLAPSEVEAWLTRLLEVWRDTLPSDAPVVEPWDWFYANGAASREADRRLPLPKIVDAAVRYYEELGAAPGQIGVELDLAPRRGKDPVASTDFLRHGRYENGSWRRGAYRVSASYREGGLGNLYELMHELGHAAHIAAIRTRPPFCDWPDSDVLSEALADMLGLSAYDPAWQRRHLGVKAPVGDALRSRLADSILDVAWALLEIRAHRDAGADPSALWAELTSQYLGIAAHPELPWWAMRGQLIDSPGYMSNYALGAVVGEALRARVREVRGADAFEAPAPSLYAWLSERLYRFGLERPSRVVVLDFLGRPLTPEPLEKLIAEAHRRP